MGLVWRGQDSSSKRERNRGRKEIRNNRKNYDSKKGVQIHLRQMQIQAEMIAASTATHGKETDKEGLTAFQFKSVIFVDEVVDEVGEDLLHIMAFEWGMALRGEGTGSMREIDGEG